MRRPRGHLATLALAALWSCTRALVHPARPRTRGRVLRTATLDEKEITLKERKAQSPVESIGDDMCLIPGEVVVRVDAAPGNSRRIYMGVDINADVPTVWDLLTDYEGLADVVPNLVSNEVIKKTEAGAQIRQIGAAQVLPGVSFKAKMIVDVGEVIGGLDPANIRRGELLDTNEDEEELRHAERRERLERGVFPRPWATATSDPALTRDITMVSAVGEPGDFTLYQGLWRAQPLPNCGIDGGDATRLTYAVEIQPRPWLPVALVENRIAKDLVKNLEAVAVEAAVRYRRDSLDRVQDVLDAPDPQKVVAAIQIPKPEDAVRRARDRLLQTVRRCSNAGLGAALIDVKAIRVEAEALASKARDADIAENALRPGRGYAPSVFDARRFAGAWDVAYSSAVAGATRAPVQALASTSSVVKYSRESVLPRRRDRLRSRLPGPGAVVGLFPRTTEALGKFALKSLEFRVKPSAAGDAVDTVMAFRARATPLLPPPAIRVEHALAAPKAPYAATLLTKSVVVEPAGASGRLARLPRPAIPPSLLPAWLPGVNRPMSFSVLYADDNLLVTLSDDDDLRVARKKPM